MNKFAGMSADLEDMLSYELEALQYLRAALFSESDGTDCECITVRLGDYGDEGRLRRHVSMLIQDDVCAGSVRAALSRLRPLAFNAAFKMQDMIVEWILRENGRTGWSFQEKIRDYESLSASGSLVEPDLFFSRPFVSKAFWKLFKYFVPYRSALVHSGGVSIYNNGTLQINGRNDSLVLGVLEQGAYLRALCIIAKCLVGQAKLSSYLEAVLESALAKLIAYHGISEVRDRHVLLSKLKILVPSDQLLADHPLSVLIDWDLMRAVVGETLLLPARGDVFFPATVEVQRDGIISRWELPLEAVPTGAGKLAQGDPMFDVYLTHQGGLSIVAVRSMRPRSSQGTA
jgi:hypothetical protein